MRRIYKITAVLVTSIWLIAIYDALDFATGTLKTLSKLSMIRRRPANTSVLNRPESWSPQGLGELGVAVRMKSEFDAVEEEILLNKYGHNVLLSNRISLHRQLRDSRHDS